MPRHLLFLFEQFFLSFFLGFPVAITKAHMDKSALGCPHTKRVGGFRLPPPKVLGLALKGKGGGGHSYRWKKKASAAVFFFLQKGGETNLSLLAMIPRLRSMIDG